MSNRRDYLSECNDQKVPVEDFQRAFCSRCMQPECGRSQHGTTKFDQRTLTWEERLFLNVPTMTKDDPRYLPIVGQDFRTVDTGRTSVAFPNAPPVWNDPRDIPQNPPPPPVTKAEPVPTMPEPEARPSMETETPLAPPPPAGVRNLPRHLLLMNTPPQPTMLPGAPEQQAPADPWAGPVPKEDAPPPAPIVKKGARIKFGGGGVE